MEEPYFKAVNLNPILYHNELVNPRCVRAVHAKGTGSQAKTDTEFTAYVF